MFSPQTNTANASQVISVVVTVSNTASAPGANALTVSATLAANASFSLLQSPAGGVLLAPGVSKSFTWTYSCTTVGSFNFTSNASGLDSVSGLTVTAAPASISAFTVTPPLALLAQSGNPIGLINVPSGVPVTNGLLALGSSYALTFTGPQLRPGKRDGYHPNARPGVGGCHRHGERSG